MNQKGIVFLGTYSNTGIFHYSFHRGLSLLWNRNSLPGYTHISMFFTAGICFLLIGAVEALFHANFPFCCKCFLWSDDHNYRISGRTSCQSPVPFKRLGLHRTPIQYTRADLSAEQHALVSPVRSFHPVV